jgi:hypothetical protein
MTADNRHVTTATAHLESELAKASASRGSPTSAAEPALSEAEGRLAGCSGAKED